MADSWNNISTKSPGLLITSEEYNWLMANLRLLKGGAGGAAPVSDIATLAVSGTRGIMVRIGGNAYVANDVITFRATFAMTLATARAGLGKTAPTGDTLDVDIRYHATDPTSAVTILASDISVAATAFSATATPSTTAIAAGGFFTVDINNIGSTLPGTDIIIELFET